jgi:hypothetical protein
MSDFRTFRYLPLLSVQLLAIAAVAATLMIVALPSSAQAQANFDRPGGDYAHSEVLSGDPAACALACERDRRCRSWSFNYPTAKRNSAICWLKSSVPRRYADTCCVSGVRGAGVVELRNRKLEIATDRYGGDYRSMSVPSDSEGDHCKAACEADHRCRAWTYARPGYAGRDARCYLKDRIKPPRRKPGFISGVVR